MPGPFGGSLWDVLTGNSMTPEQQAAEKARILAFQQQQALARQQAAARAAAEQQKALAFRGPPAAQPNMAPARAVGQGYYEPGFVHDARKFLTNDVILPIADAAVGEGPIWDAAGNAVQAARNATGGMFETPYSREKAAAAVPKLATAVATPAAKPVATPAVARDEPISGLTFNTAGGQVTSAYRTPEHNKEVGGKANSWHIRGTPENPLARDLVPPRGMPMGEYFLKVKKENPGMHVINEGDHIHVQPPKGFQPGSSTLAGGTDLPQTRAMRDTIQGFMPNVPAPHEEGYDIMRGAIAESAARATQPFSYSYETAQRPDLPTPTLAERPDYAPADAAFAAGRPTNPFGADVAEQEKNKLKMRRASYFSGLASGLANYRDGQGLGQLFANMGGAALQGRFQGDENVRAKLEEFDNNMARYNLAMANREEGKAKDFANIANDNIRTINRYNEQKYNVEMNKYDETKPRIDEQGRLVTTNVDPATGQTTVNVSTVDPTALSKFLVSHAQNEINRYAGRTEAEQMEYRQQMALTNALIPQAMAEASRVGDWQKRDQLAIYAGSQAAVQLVQQGTWAQAMGEVPGGAAAAAAMDSEAWRAAGVEIDEKTGRPNLLSGKVSERQQELHDNFIASNLVGYFLDSGHMSNLVGGLVQDIIPGTGPGTGRDAMLPKGQPKYRYKGPSPTVTQSIEAFKAGNTKRTSRETAKGVFDTETTDYAR